MHALIADPAPRLFRLASCLLALWAAGSARAQTVDGVMASIRFSATSTLHDFEGHATSEPFSIEVREDPASRQPRLTASVKVSVPGISTDHDGRDGKMYRMLDAKHFPAIEGCIEDAEVPASGSGDVDLRLKIHGREQTVSATVSAWRLEDGHPSFQLAFPVSLRAYGLEPPSVLGMIRVGDTVRVECTVATAREVAATSEKAHEEPES